MREGAEKQKPPIEVRRVITQEKTWMLPMNQIGKIPGIDVPRNESDVSQAGGGIAMCD